MTLKNHYKLINKIKLMCYKRILNFILPVLYSPTEPVNFLVKSIKQCAASGFELAALRFYTVTS